MTTFIYHTETETDTLNLFYGSMKYQPVSYHVNNDNSVDPYKQHPTSYLIYLHSIRSQPGLTAPRRPHHGPGPGPGSRVLESDPNIITVHSQEAVPRPPNPCLELDDRSEPNVEVHNAISLPFLVQDPAHDAGAQMSPHRYQFRVDIGDVARSLKERGKPGLGDQAVVVEDGSRDPIVRDAHLLVRVSDGQIKVEVR